MKQTLLVILSSIQLVAVVKEITIYNSQSTIISSLQCSDAPVVYKSINIECNSLPKYAVNVSCEIKALNWNKAVVNVDVDLVRPLRNTSVS